MLHAAVRGSWSTLQLLHHLHAVPKEGKDTVLNNLTEQALIASKTARQSKKPFPIQSTSQLIYYRGVRCDCCCSLHPVHCPAYLSTQCRVMELGWRHEDISSPQLHLSSAVQCPLSTPYHLIAACHNNSTYRGVKLCEAVELISAASAGLQSVVSVQYIFNADG